MILEHFIIAKKTFDYWKEHGYFPKKLVQNAWHHPCLETILDFHNLWWAWPICCCLYLIITIDRLETRVGGKPGLRRLELVLEQHWYTVSQPESEHCFPLGSFFIFFSSLCFRITDLFDFFKIVGNNKYQSHRCVLKNWQKKEAGISICDRIHKERK